MPDLKRHVKAYGEHVEVLATMDLGKMWDRFLGEFLDHWVELDRQGLSEADMERAMQAFMDDLSAKPIEDMARTSSTVAYNQGRAVSILEAADKAEVQYVVRSEILDSNTCEMCEQLDNFIAEIGQPEFDQYMPPAYCLGGARCRGFYVPIANRGEIA